MSQMKNTMYKNNSEILDINKSRKTSSFNSCCRARDEASSISTYILQNGRNPPPHLNIHYFSQIKPYFA